MYFLGKNDRIEQYQCWGWGEFQLPMRDRVYVNRSHSMYSSQKIQLKWKFVFQKLQNTE